MGAFSWNGPSLPGIAPIVCLFLKPPETPSLLLSGTSSDDCSSRCWRSAHVSLVRSILTIYGNRVAGGSASLASTRPREKANGVPGARRCFSLSDTRAARLGQELAIALVRWSVDGRRNRGGSPCQALMMFRISRFAPAEPAPGPSWAASTADKIIGRILLNSARESGQPSLVPKRSRDHRRNPAIR